MPQMWGEREWEESYLMCHLLSHVFLQLLKLFCGITAELVISFFESIQLDWNLHLLLIRKPAVWEARQLEQKHSRWAAKQQQQLVEILPSNTQSCPCKRSSWPKPSNTNEPHFPKASKVNGGWLVYKYSTSRNLCLFNKSILIPLSISKMWLGYRKME